jgi:hypothetical protein
MSSLYGSTQEKRAGIVKEPDVKDAFIESLQKTGFKIISALKSSINEDMHYKYDYKITFDSTTPFGRNRLTEILVDIKYGKTYTIYDNKGQNTLRTSKSDYIVYMFPDNEKQLLIINSQRLKECLSNRDCNLPLMRDCKEVVNISKYFLIEELLNTNKDFMNTYYYFIKLT